MERLVKRYRAASRNAVDGISFAVPAGQLFCLLGPNGAGKTTTVSVLTTTLAPTAGRVRIAGLDLARDQARVRRELGVVFQQPSLDLNLSAEENIRLHAVLYGLYPWRPSYRTMPAGYRHQVQEMAGVLGLTGLLRQRGPYAVRRPAAPAGDRPRAHAPPPGAVPRRADRRPGPGEPPRPVGLPGPGQGRAAAPPCS